MFERKQFKPREIQRLLESLGFNYKPGKNGHNKFTHPECTTSMVIDQPTKSRDVPRSTIVYICRYIEEHFPHWVP